MRHKTLITLTFEGFPRLPPDLQISLRHLMQKIFEPRLKYHMKPEVSSKTQNIEH